MAYSITPVGEKHGVKNVLVYTDATDNPTITQVVRISDDISDRFDVETDISNIRRTIYELEKQGYTEWDEVVDAIYGKGAVIRTVRESVPDYRTRKSQIHNQSGTGQGGGNQSAGIGAGNKGRQNGGKYKDSSGAIVYYDEAAEKGKYSKEKKPSDDGSFNASNLATQWEENGV